MLGKLLRFEVIFNLTAEERATALFCVLSGSDCLHPPNGGLDIDSEHVRGHVI